MKLSHLICLLFALAVMISPAHAQESTVPTRTHPWHYVGTCSGSGNGKHAEGPCVIWVMAKSDPRNFCGEKFEIRTKFTTSEDGTQGHPGPNFSGMPLKLDGDKFAPACPSIAGGKTQYSGGGTISESSIEGELTVRAEDFGSEPNKFTLKATAK